MVAAVRGGRSMREVSRDWRVSLSTVQLWAQRAHGCPLDQVSWADRSSRPRHTRRTPWAIEDLVLRVRQDLKDTSDLGEFGAAAIHAELLGRGQPSVPSVRTLGRILERRGALDARRRVRRPPPPRGWYLPAVARGEAELDSADIIEGLALRGGLQVEVLTVISLHGGLAASWPTLPLTASTVVEALLEHWRAVGLPTYAQFDNDAIFQGPHHRRDSIGRVTRVCLSLGVVPVFAPPREPGLQAAIEAFNGRWQVKVWARNYLWANRVLEFRFEVMALSATTASASTPDPSPAGEQRTRAVRRRASSQGRSCRVGLLSPAVWPLSPERLQRPAARES
jgi:hypothetical protein